MSMKVLRYRGLDTQGFERKISAIEHHLAKGDFRSADVKKMVSSGLYRAKLDNDNRLLFSIASHNSQKVILLLELIRSHRYEKSRFLNGKIPDPAYVDETIHSMDSLTPQSEIKFLNEGNREFHFLNKPIIFDQEQENLFHFPLPSIVVGSAGSGKTAISLEKMKTLSGDILYVTLSSYLAENSRDLYYASGYGNDKQNIDFMSFNEFLESFAIPDGSEIKFSEFKRWLFAQKVKDFDAHELFEEFKGVLTGVNVTKPYLTREEYLMLGIKQSIFLENDRETVYELFTRYLSYLRKKDLYDINILCHSYLDLIEKRYEYLFIDEIQDFTNIQIFLLLKSLKKKSNSQFLFCGDSNQIVHPNFFSWSHLKSLFFKEDITKNRIFNILHRNYRSSKEVTELANKILRIKNKRFGSIDKESNYLITPIGDEKGKVDLYSDKEKNLKTLNKQTSQSIKFAVIVLHDQDKAKAGIVFKTPLLFSIREVKGLEYENIILYNFVGGEKTVFNEIVDGVTESDLAISELGFSRAKNKNDKSLEIYKFFINSLYVAISRSTKNLVWIEQDLRHPLIKVLNLKEKSGDLNVHAKKSSQEEWQREALRLEKQGKEEQAEAIRSQVLKIKPVPWTPFSEKDLDNLIIEAYQKQIKQAQRQYLAYGVLYHDPNVFEELSQGYSVSSSHKGRKEFSIKRFCKEWVNESEFSRAIKEYGIDHKNRFGQTPLMGAVHLGNISLVRKLLNEGAQTTITDFAGRTAFAIASSEAILDPDYRNNVYPKMFELLSPSSIKIKVDNKLIKIDRRLMEYTFINFFKVSLMYWIRLQKRTDMTPSFNAQALTDFIDKFPASIVPERRKKRTYVSSILSKNEVNRNDLYNRKIFLRQRVGFYLLNPKVEIWEDENWVSLYSILGLNRLIKTTSDANKRFKISYLQDVKKHGGQKFP